MADKTPKKAPPRRTKKPWESPRVKTGRLFESNSLACGKNSPSTEQCMRNATLS